MTSMVVRYINLIQRHVNVVEPTILPNKISKLGSAKFGLRFVQLCSILMQIIWRNPSEIQYLPGWLLSLRRESPVIAHTPLIPYSAIRYLNRLLHLDDSVFEYGSGGSTLWLADRVQRIVSVEHTSYWYERVEQEVARTKPAASVTLVLKPVDELQVEGSSNEENRATAASRKLDDYINVVDQFEDDSFDLVFVDGLDTIRVACITRAQNKVRPGGLLVLDDSSRPSYNEVNALLRSWSREKFWGVRPHFVWPSQTTCWRRPRQ